MLTKNEVFNISSLYEFEKLALKTFYYQAENNIIYKEFIQNLKINISDVKKISEIPFLPIDFFKTHQITSFAFESNFFFTSSGTSSSVQSKHYINDISWYEESFLNGFEYFYGDVQQYCILALLPNYQERGGSSLIYMVDELIKKSARNGSGYFLNQNDTLYQVLKNQIKKNQKTILIGVTYALLDFIETYKIDFPDLIVMETGGMKGKRKEIIRDELHKILKAGFNVNSIQSEYGMTELLSQAYAKSDGKFLCPNWMNVYIRDINDPLSIIDYNKVGGINVIDLANQESCSFIATQDLGKKLLSQHFEILGRFDYSDIRGCNLLVGS